MSLEYVGNTPIAIPIDTLNIDVVTLKESQSTTKNGTFSRKAIYAYRLWTKFEVEQGPGTPTPSQYQYVWDLDGKNPISELEKRMTTGKAILRYTSEPEYLVDSVELPETIENNRKTYNVSVKLQGRQSNNGILISKLFRIALSKSINEIGETSAKDKTINERIAEIKSIAVTDISLPLEGFADTKLPNQDTNSYSQKWLEKEKRIHDIVNTYRLQYSELTSDVAGLCVCNQENEDAHKVYLMMITSYAYDLLEFSRKDIIGTVKHERQHVRQHIAIATDDGNVWRSLSGILSVNGCSDFREAECSGMDITSQTLSWFYVKKGFDFLKQKYNGAYGLIYQNPLQGETETRDQAIRLLRTIYDNSPEEVKRKDYDDYVRAPKP